MFSESHTSEQIPSPQLRDEFIAAVNLIEAGWTFAAEPTADFHWRVVGSKGDVRFVAIAVHLGDAFQTVERQAQEREAGGRFPVALAS